MTSLFYRIRRGKQGRPGKIGRGLAFGILPAPRVHEYVHPGGEIVTMQYATPSVVAVGRVDYPETWRFFSRDGAPFRRQGSPGRMNVAERLCCYQGHRWEPTFPLNVWPPDFRSSCPVCGEKPIGPT